MSSCFRSTRMSMTTLGMLCFGLLALSCAQTQAQNKPELDVPEVIINITTPELMKGMKEQISTLEGQHALQLVSDTVSKSTLDLPDALKITEQPTLNAPKSCFSPCFGSPIASLFGTSGRFGAAAKAASKEKWVKAVELLMPIAMRDPPEERTPDALFFIGQCHMNLGDPGSAAGSLDRLRRLFPDHALSEHATYELGWIYLQSGNYDRASEMTAQFRVDYPASPLMPYARYLQSAIYYAAGNYKSALIELEGIVGGYPMFPYLPETQFWVAENLYFLRNLDAAITQYTDYLRNFPDGERAAEALYGRAFCWLDQMNYDVALADFQSLIQRFPSKSLSCEAAYQSGKIYMIKGDDAAAIRYLKLASQMESRSPLRDLEIKGWIEYESGNFAKAYDVFVQLSTEMSGSLHAQDMSFMAALCLYQEKRYLDSANGFLEVADRAKGNLAFAARANAGIAMMRAGRLEDAISQIDQALSSPMELRGHELYAMYGAEILYRLGRFDESRARFERLRDRSLQEELMVEVERGIAWNFYAVKAWQEAATVFGGFARQFPKSKFRPEALLRQAECHFNLQDYETARTRFSALIETYPIHPEALEARLMIAQIDWIQGHFDTATSTLDNAFRLASQPRDRQRIRILMGDLERNRGEFQKAADFYRTAYLDHADSDLAPMALLKQADSVYSLENYTLAVSIYRQIIDRFPNAPEAATAQYSLGLTYFQANQIDDYLKECRDIARNHPGSPQASLALSGAVDVLMDQKRYDEAITIYQQMVDDPNPAMDTQMIRFRLAQAYASAGRSTDAEREYRNVMTQSEHGLYAADAAMELSDIDLAAGNHAEAHDLLNWIIEQFPNHPRMAAVLIRAGKLALDMKQYEIASSHLKRLVEQFPASDQLIDAWVMLATIGLEMGRCEEYLGYLEQASRSPDRRIQAQTVIIKARCLESVKKQDEALQEYLKITYLFHDVPEAVIDASRRAGDILTAQNKIEDAAKLYAKAKALESGDTSSTEASQAVTPTATPKKDAPSKDTAAKKPKSSTSNSKKSKKPGKK